MLEEEERQKQVRDMLYDLGLEAKLVRQDPKIFTQEVLVAIWKRQQQHDELHKKYGPFFMKRGRSND